MIKSASEIKATGAAGAYTVEFDNMEKKINEVKNILQTTTKSSTDLQTLNDVIDQLRYLHIDISIDIPFYILCHG